MPWLINAAQLDKFRKSQKSLVVLDASWHMPSEVRDAHKEFIDKHIVDAQFFDIDFFSDCSPDAPHPHMLIQDEKIINEKLSQLGIRNDYKIIFYDNSDLHTSCRAAWMFKMFGHNPQQLYILDGGLKAWEQYKGKLATGDVIPSPKQYKATLQKTFIRSLDQVKELLHNDVLEQIVDVRHAVRYAGGKEIRPNVRSGHIPGSFSFPYTSFFDKEGAFRSLDKIKLILSCVGIELNQPIISMCGSGISAPILDFVLDLMDHPKHAVYNGSWNEWGAEKLYPGEISLAERPVRTAVD